MGERVYRRLMPRGGPELAESTLYIQENSDQSYVIVINEAENAKPVWRHELVASRMLRKILGYPAPRQYTLRPRSSGYRAFNVTDKAFQHGL